MPKVLFIAAHRPNRSPSQRFRFEQYFSYLESSGFHCQLSYFISANDDAFFYQPGYFFKKSIILAKAFLVRLKDALTYSRYDIIFVQREAMMLGTTFFEKLIKGSGAKFIFDFDDSIWLMDTSDANKKFEWLKNPAKTSINISLANLVLAGNEYLAGYAKAFNENTIVVPTTIDTDIFKPLPKKENDKIIIGWSGSMTTIKHFESAVPFLKLLKEKFGDKIGFCVVGDINYINKDLGIAGTAWTAENEVEVLNSFDIGIMPLPDDEWVKGKCGLKGLSYMALETPTVMSAVGVNNSIIQNGKNGFLASTKEEWINILEQLIESKELRQQIGLAARKTVLQNYSVKSQRDVYLNSFKKVLQSTS